MGPREGTSSYAGALTADRTRGAATRKASDCPMAWEKSRRENIVGRIEAPRLETGAHIIMLLQPKNAAVPSFTSFLFAALVLSRSHRLPYRSERAARSFKSNHAQLLALQLVIFHEKVSNRRL